MCRDLFFSSRPRRHNRGLLRLELAHNSVGPRGGTALAEALGRNATLTQLGLASNLLDDTAAVALATALCANGVLTALLLGRNSISDVGAQALRQALTTNRTLHSMGDVGSLPIAIGLRASLDWYLRGNAELSARAAKEQLSLARQVSSGGGAPIMQPVEERQMQVTARPPPLAC